MSENVFSDYSAKLTVPKESYDSYLNDAVWSLFLAGNSLGDVNGDEEINITDVVGLTNHILGVTSSSFVETNADVNGDSEINSDVFESARNAENESARENTMVSGILPKFASEMIGRMNILEFNHRNDLRQWLCLNSEKEKECWIACSRSSHIPEGALSYLDVVEEALCFGWIDSTVKTVDGLSIQRISPRRKNSKWSELNKERCRRLERLGLMTDLGRAVLPDMDISHFQVCDEILSALKKDHIVWENYQSFPALYCRVRIDTIQIKRNTGLFESRLNKFIENTRRNIMYGAWNDGGRLLEK